VDSECNEMFFIGTKHIIYHKISMQSCILQKKNCHKSFPIKILVIMNANRQKDAYPDAIF